MLKRTAAAAEVDHNKSPKEQKDQLTLRMERGALRRQRYTHWAVAQLLCVGPVLPIHELSPEEIQSCARRASTLR